MRRLRSSLVGPLLRCVLPCVLLAAAVGSCSKKSSTGPGSGVLVISVQPPARSTANVEVTGPDGFAVAVGSTDTLVGLASGTYTVTAARAVASDPIVGVAYTGTVTGSPATVSSSDTVAIAITFTARSGSGGLWVARSTGGHSVADRFTSAELAGDSTPGIALTVAAAHEAFDGQGNLWIADSATNTITQYAAAALAVSGTPPAAVTITSSSLHGPIGLAFDRAGDLWIANYDSSTVVEFAPTQLTASGALTPIVILSGAALDGPARIAFDSSGNLWIPNRVSNTVVALDSASLTTTGTPLPSITLTASDTSLSGPTAVAFDAQGDLWVANAAGNRIVGYQRSQIAGSGSVGPFVILVMPSGFTSPTSIAFDNSGDLWTTSTAGAALIEFTGPEIAAGGTTTPTIVPVTSAPVSIAFDPPANSVPLAGALTADLGRMSIAGHDRQHHQLRR